jgi:hypothetical protein
VRVEAVGARSSANRIAVQVLFLLAARAELAAGGIKVKPQGVELLSLARPCLDRMLRSTREQIHRRDRARGSPGAPASRDPRLRSLPGTRSSPQCAGARFVAECVDELEKLGELFRTDLDDAACKQNPHKVGADTDGKPSGCDNVQVRISGGEVRVSAPGGLSHPRGRGHSPEEPLTRAARVP